MRKPPTSRPAAPPAHFADPVIDEFLEGQPRSDTWRELRESLQGRLDDARADLASASPDDPRSLDLARRVRELKTQVAALAQEEAVTQFVEESVRASLSRPLSGNNDDEDDDGGPY